MRKVWTTDFYKYGVLSFERVLFEYDYIPITFVCVDRVGNRYLCHCTDAIDETTWLVAGVKKAELIDALKNAVSLKHWLKQQEEVVLFTASEDGADYKLYRGLEIPNDELPDAGYSLIGDFSDYIDILQADNCILFIEKFNREVKNIVRFPVMEKQYERNKGYLKTQFDRVKVADRNKKQKQQLMEGWTDAHWLEE